MTSFGWKRKRQLESRAAAAWFTDPATADEEEDEEGDGEEGVDWLSAAKRRRLLLLEDNQSKSLRLREEGALLAENERYWEAIKYWDEAIQLTPNVAALYEMKSQVHLAPPTCHILPHSMLHNYYAMCTGSDGTE